jgi:hypothetical protein
LQEKGGKQHAMPCHHNLETYLHEYHEYMDGAGLANDPKAQTYNRGPASSPAILCTKRMPMR